MKSLIDDAEDKAVEEIAFRNTIEEFTGENKASTLGIEASLVYSRKRSLR